MADVYMERIIEAGKVREKILYRVHANTQPRRGRRKGATLARKQDANERSCVKRFARILNANYAHGDLMLGLTFSDVEIRKLIDKVGTDINAIYEAVEHEAELGMRRFKRALGEKGKDLRAVIVVSDMDGDTGEMVRPHIHMIVPAEGFSMRDGVLMIAEKSVEKVWKKGIVNYQPLRDQDDYTPLAEYLMRQVRRRPDAKKYKTTRNMRKPRLVSERLVYRNAPIKAPKGAKVLHISEYVPGEAQYVRYIPAKPKTNRKRGGLPDGQDENL